MKVAVYFMFSVITVGVFAIWLFHKDSVESLRFGSDFILTVKLRSLEVRNSEGMGVLYGEMGLRLRATRYDHCWQEGKVREPVDGCVEWKKMAQLHVNRSDIDNDNQPSASTCYTLSWESLTDAFSVEDCYYLQDYLWFGYLNNYTQPWPVEGVSLTEFDYYQSYPEQQTINLVPIWFGSQGVSIFVDSSFPFAISWNVSDKKQFCLMSRKKFDADANSTKLLQYTICQSSSIRDVYVATHDYQRGIDGNLTNETDYSSLLLANLSKPIISGNLTEIESQLNSSCSLVEVDDRWEREFGDLVVDGDREEEISDVINTAGRRECRPMFPISGFFSYNSKNFEEGVKKQYFMKDNLDLVTKLVKWRGKEGAVLDVSNPHAIDWFLDLAANLRDTYSIGAFRMYHLNLPSDSVYQSSNITYLDYTRVFYKELTSLNIPVLLEVATGFISFPVYIPVRLTFHGPPGSSCLNSSIPFSVTLGMSGYSLLVAESDETALLSASREMLYRWLQLAIFFPVFKIPNIPLMKEDIMQRYLQDLMEFRNAKILPHLTSALDERSTRPAIRPLSWLAPEDEVAVRVSDQFLLGGKLMVAPALCENSTQRQVYFPPGTVWHIKESDFGGKNFSSKQNTDSHVARERNFSTWSTATVLDSVNRTFDVIPYFEL